MYHDNTSKWVLGQVASSTNTNTGLVEYATTYDATSALPLQTYAFGKLQQTLTYNANGTVATVKDGNSNVTAFSSWKRGIPQMIQHPATPEATAGAIQSAVADNNGWITSVTDETSSKTCYEYDPMGRIAKIIYPSETQANVCDASNWTNTIVLFEQISVAEYGIPAGHWRKTTTTGTGRKLVYFDALWRPSIVREDDTSQITETRRLIRNTYDHDGRLIFTSYPVADGTPPNIGMHTTYDALGRVQIVRQDWEGTGQLTTTTSYLPGFKLQVTNPRGFQTTTEYMAYDRPVTEWPIRVTAPGGGVTDISRDVFGKPRELMRSGPN
ncbi:hypothetical protein ACYX7E_14770 [Luteimonas sp. RIT-PG2_3]